MPPIPLQQHVFSDPDITLAISALQQRETYLSSSVIPQLAKLSPTSSLLEQQRLSAELREDLEDFGRRVESLEQLVEDLSKPLERQTGRQVVEGWAITYANLKKEARTALLASKRNIDAHAKSRRDELLGSAALHGPKVDENEKTDDALMRTTANLTDALRRTEARLRAELDRSMLSTQLLTSQTATLRQTTDAHGRLSGLLDTSKGLITALERTDWLDRVLIIGALAVFLLACAWIVKVRVFDRAVGIAFWWVRFLPSVDLGVGGDADAKMIQELEKGARVASSTLQDAAATSALSAVAQSLYATLSGTSTILSEATSIVHPEIESELARLGEGALLETLTSVTSSALSQSTSETLVTETLISVLRDEL